MPARGTVGSNTECGYATRPQPSTHKAQGPASAERRQDPRAVHDLRGSRSERGPSWQDLRAVHSRTPVCGAFRMHGANILPKPAHFGCTAAICCRELAFFPSEAPSGTHEAKKLPRIAARERTTAISCHCRTPESAVREHFAIGKRPPGGASRRNIATVGSPENAPRRNITMAGSPGTHRSNILPRQPPSRILLNDILPRRPWAARPCCEIAAAPRSRKTPPERSVGQFNNARRHVQETMKIFWCLSPRNGTENVLA